MMAKFLQHIPIRLDSGEVGSAGWARCCNAEWLAGISVDSWQALPLRGINPVRMPKGFDVRGAQ
jgi:hypothetical protein